MKRNKFWVMMGVLLTSLSACVSTGHHYSSSVVEYLYPEQSNHVVTEQIPTLRLPLRVGIAFVPDESFKRTGGRNAADILFNSGASVSEYTLDETQKLALMKQVKEHFSRYDFVKSIEIIPSNYLRAGGSFANLNQISTMFGIDVIALLSYDQTRFTDEGVASITYWTLVGAYLVPGEKNDTHTMVDAAVYDIASQKLLFRAPGVSHIHSKATPVNLSEQTRLDAQQGFQKASENLIVSLDKKLQEFREKVKASPEAYHIEHASGASFGGALSPWDLAVLPLLLVFWRKYR